jgi:hypothetical protein
MKGALAVNAKTLRGNVLLLGLVSAGLIVLAGCGATTSLSVATNPPAASTSVPAPAASGSPATAATPNASPLVAGVCTPTPTKFDAQAIDLTGAWAGDDGGIYYVRQRGTVVWWNGMSSRDGPPEGLGREWNNVGHGEIKDLTLVADWVDVPRGGIDGYGIVTFKIGADSVGNIQLTKTKDEGTGRGDTLWIRCEPGFFH